MASLQKAEPAVNEHSYSIDDIDQDNAQVQVDTINIDSLVNSMCKLNIIKKRKKCGTQENKEVCQPCVTLRRSLRAKRSGDKDINELENLTNEGNNLRETYTYLYVAYNDFAVFYKNLLKAVDGDDKALAKKELARVERYTELFDSAIFSSLYATMSHYIKGMDRTRTTGTGKSFEDIWKERKQSNPKSVDRFKKCMLEIRPIFRKLTQGVLKMADATTNAHKGLVANLPDAERAQALEEIYNKYKPQVNFIIKLLNEVDILEDVIIDEEDDVKEISDMMTTVLANDNSTTKRAKIQTSKGGKPKGQKQATTKKPVPKKQTIAKAQTVGKATKKAVEKKPAAKPKKA